MAMKSIEIDFGHASWHSPWLVQEPKNSSMVSTMAFTRSKRSGWPCGNRLSWPAFAEVKSWAAEFGHAATHAPQPMHAAASIAPSATVLGIRISFASRAAPVGAVMNPPDSTMRSNAERSTQRSFTIGKPAARHGSTVIVSPSVNLRMCSWHVAVPFCGPCACPLIITPQLPQMPSRQSWSNAIGSRPSSISRSFTTSRNSRNDISGDTPGASIVSNAPGLSGPYWRQTRRVIVISMSCDLTCSCARRA